MLSSYHTLVELTLASRDGTGWTVDFRKDGSLPVMIMGATPLEVLTKAAAHFDLPVRK